MKPPSGEGAGNPEVPQPPSRIQVGEPTNLVNTRSPTYLYGCCKSSIAVSDRYCARSLLAGGGLILNTRQEY